MTAFVLLDLSPYLTHWRKFPVLCLLANQNTVFGIDIPNVVKNIIFLF